MTPPPDQAAYAVTTFLLVCVSAALLLGCWLHARRWASGWVAGRDAVAGWLALTYGCVLLLGLAGVLTGWAIVILGGVVAATLLLTAPRRRPDLPPTVAGPSYHIWPVLFAAGFVAGLVHHQRLLPVVSTDPLVYHMPTAVHWLQRGRAALYDVWYWMPANTYSPLAGTAWTVWLLGPLGTDVLARGVQLLAVALTAVAGGALLRGAGTRPTIIAAAVGAVVVSRPVVSQALLPKDDLFVVAFLLAAVSGLRIRDDDADEPDAAGLTCPPGVPLLHPLRLGVFVGLLVATKYTALLSLPVLLIGADAPLRARWGWRQWLAAAAGPVVLAGPWFVRNWVVAGNPLYPVSVLGLPGLFTADRSETLASVAGVWGMLTQAGHLHSMPAALLWVLIALYAVAVATARRDDWRDPATRTLLLGPVVGLGAFVLFSPHAEIRYMFPVLVLLTLNAGLAIDRAVERVARRFGDLRDPSELAPGRAERASASPSERVALRNRTVLVVGDLPALGLLALATATAFGTAAWARGAWTFVVVGALTAVVGVALVAVGQRARDPSRAWTFAFVAAAGVLGAGVPYAVPLADYRDWTTESWQLQYGPQAEAWAFVRDTTPPGSTIAFANATHVYPLYGFDLSRRVVHAPVRPGVRHLHDLPPLPGTVRADDVIRTMGTWTSEGADVETWLANLTGVGADYLYVSKHEASDDPVERKLIARRPGRFSRVFENAAAVVYRVGSAGE